MMKNNLFQPIGFKIGHEGLQIKMKSFDVEAIKDRLKNWTKFKEIEDEEKKKNYKHALQTN